MHRKWCGQRPGGEREYSVLQKLKRVFCFRGWYFQGGDWREMKRRLPLWLSGEASASQCRRCRRHGFSPWVGKIPWRKKWQPTPVFLPGESHKQRSLVAYSPWSRKESDVTEHALRALSEKRGVKKRSDYKEFIFEETKGLNFILR